jgi:hypothetical protein
MRADIHDGSEHHTLQSEAGYIDARPHRQDPTKPLAPHGRTIQTGQKPRLPHRNTDGRFTSVSGHYAGDLPALPTRLGRHAAAPFAPSKGTAAASNNREI